MSEYIKPTVISTEDLSEGIYASSGTPNSAANNSESGLTVTRGTDTTQGQYHFNVAVANEYVGKHVKIHLSFDRQLTGGWAQASGQPQGTDFDLEHWGMVQTLDVTVCSQGEPAYTGGNISIAQN